MYPSHSPETVESLFIAFRLTGNPYYREVGWKIFGAIQKFCRVETGGYASILNVDHDNTIQMDKMETFFLVSVLLARLDDRCKLTFMPDLQSETLKYLYLLFSDDTVIPLDSKSLVINCPCAFLTMSIDRICLQYGGTPHPYLHPYGEIRLPLRTFSYFTMYFYNIISKKKGYRPMARFLDRNFTYSD